MQGLAGDPRYDYKGLNFALYRQAIRTDVPIQTFSTDAYVNQVTKEDIIAAIGTPRNLDLLTQLIIGRNSMGLPVDAPGVREKVARTVTAWIDMGKFNRPNSALSINHLIDHYNQEFVREFAETILPTDAIKVQSVTNPNGMYAQQTRTLSFKSKAPPFWERALYRRLEDRVRDIPIDETEGPFYKFENTGKKMPEAVRLGDIFEREEPTFRMLR